MSDRCNDVLFARVVAIVASVSERPLKEVAPETLLLTGLDLTSIDILEILIQLEEQFDVQFTEDFLLRDQEPSLGSLTDAVREAAGQ